MFVNPDNLSEYEKNQFSHVGEGLFVRMTEREFRLENRNRLVFGFLFNGKFSAREQVRIMKRSERKHKADKSRLRKSLIDRLKKHPDQTEYYFGDGNDRSPDELATVLRRLSSY